MTEKVWRVRASAKLLDASNTVHEEDCRAMLLILVKKCESGEYEMSVQANGGDDFIPSQMADIMRRFASGVEDRAYEIKEAIH